MASENSSVHARQPSGSAAAQDREDTKEPEVGGGNEETPVVETSSADSAAAKNGVNSMDKGGAVMDSLSVDAAEAVRLGTTVVEEPMEETPKANEGKIENELKADASKANEGEIENELKADASKANEGEIENELKANVSKCYEGEIDNGPKVEVPKGNEGEIENGSKLENPKGDEGKGEEGAVESSEIGSASEGSSAKVSYAEVAASGSTAAEDRVDVKGAEVRGETEKTHALETASADSATNVGSKYMGEEDAVVDSITVDATEAVRSGIAVVGESQEMKDSGTESESSKANEGEIENELKAAASKSDEGEIDNGPKVEAPKGNEGEIDNGPKLENPKGDEGKGEEGAVESSEIGSGSDGGPAKVSYAEVAASGSAAAEERVDVKGAEVRGETEKTHALETASADSATNVGSEYMGEEDAVVDFITVDATEAVRSGIAVVGESQEMKDSGTESESSKANEGEIENELKADASKGDEDEIDNGPKAEAPKGNEGEIDNGPKLENPKGDEGKGEEGAVESSEIGSASEGGPAKVSYAEVASSGSAAAEDRVVVKEAEVRGETEKTHALETASADSATNVGSKYMGEEDAVVDSITVDATEAVRSGIAVVGELQEMKDSGTESESSVVENVAKNVKGNSAAVAEDVASSNDFAPLVSENSSEVVDDGGEHKKASQTNDAEPPQPAENEEQHNTEETIPEAELQTKQQEPTDEQKSNSVGKNEKAQPLDDESDVNYALLGGEIEDRSCANDLQDEDLGAQVEGHDEGLGTDEEGQLDYFGIGSSPNKIIEELESRDRSEIDGQAVIESEEDGETDEEGEGKELFDSAAFSALLKAATNSGSDPGTITITSQDGSRLFSVERPAGLGSSLRSVRPASGPRGSNFISPSSTAAPSEDDLSEEEKKKLQNLHQLKVKFLRLVQRAGFTAENSVAAQVLYKLSLFGGRPSFPAFSLDNAKQTATQLEAEGKDDLEFSMTILVIGKTGVGKSAVINSMFLEEKVKINAFEPQTTSVTEICGTVDGVKVRFIDVPGLKSSANEQSYNRKVLESVKKVTKKNPVDVVFYVDRLDSPTRDLNDLPMLRTITASLGSSIWRNTIIALTHASSAPPDGPSGTPLSYEVFVAQRSHIVQQSIGQAVGDLRLMNLNMMSPVSLVENHPACRKNREGQKVLPNGQAWRPQLLVLCYSVKILSEASSISKPQEPYDSRKLFGFRARSPPLPYLLSSLLQPRAHPKLSADQGGDNVDSDIDLDDLSDSDQEEEVDEYDQLPPFKPLRKSQLAKLSGEQKKAYFEEYDYRVKLLQKKQWKEELKRMREMKKGKSRVGGYSEMPDGYDAENGDDDNGEPAAVPVPLPDMALPPSFDSDNPAYRYRFLEPTSQFLARPVLDTHGWDHDCGYDGVNVEQNLGIAGRFPAAVTAQVTKDKKDFNVHLDSAVAAKHGENGSSLVGFDVQSIGKQYAYIIKGESKFKNLKKNKTTAGVSVTFLGENVASGVKVEDQITLGKRLVLVGSTGTVRSQKDAAYGANVEVRLRDADYPVGQDQSSLTLTLMKWRGDLAIGGNFQSQVSVGRNSKMALRVALNNKQSGQITVKTSSSDHISIALAGLLPIALSIYQKFKPGVSESYSIY